MGLTPTDLANLIAIRSLRDLAARHGASASFTERQTAVILLDAAIERAAFTACEFRQQTIGDKQFVDTAFERLRQLGWRPEPGVETERKRLHRARNGVQHIGLNVDRDEIPGWIVATERTIASLVRFAYGVELDDVSTAMAIQDAEVKERLTAAEGLLTSGDLEGALMQASRAFDRVEALWRGFVEASDRKMRPESRHYEPGIGHFGGDSDSMIGVRRIALLSAVVPEATEAIWFLGALSDQALLNAEEVRRALAFVTTFAYAVEASPAARYEDRAKRRTREARLERTDPDMSASIAGFSVTNIGPRRSVVLHLKDVPTEESFDAWAIVVGAELNKGKELSYHFSVFGNGTISIHDAGDEFDEDLAAVEDVLSRADSLLAERRKEQQEAERERDRRREAFEDELAPACEGLPEWLTTEVIEEPFGDHVPQLVVRSTERVGLSELLVELGLRATQTTRGLRIPGSAAEASSILAQLVPLAEQAWMERKRVEAESDDRLEAVRGTLRVRGYREQER